jgi:hypothetical protein
MEGRISKDNPWWSEATAMHALPDEWRALRTHQHLICTDVEGRVFLLFDFCSDTLAVQNLAGHSKWKEVEDTLLRRMRETAHALEDPVRLGPDPHPPEHVVNTVN